MIIKECIGILKIWENNLGFAHSSGGMAYSDGELIIPLSGRYYVYSQLYFQEAKKAHLIHFVHRSRNGTKTIIMRSVASRCHGQRASNGDKVKTFLYSSYQGGVFDLLADDRILVGVSEDNKGSISTGESASYFGAFLV
ncbi:Tumor necrosis factor ligand superfamily member 10 [Acropora cervicornis]|uniref:Tumor necrosis factor ligand superfamily member 10 n=1 Tax=Acropora cervicornis TaxID=6130 RepID=A0AAD9V9W9_ACRCE|nr:Tumor necrosis factor ligand superfamily member 10 [Acropora cervicornis]